MGESPWITKQKPNNKVVWGSASMQLILGTLYPFPRKEKLLQIHPSTAAHPAGIAWVSREVTVTVLSLWCATLATGAARCWVCVGFFSSEAGVAVSSFLPCFDGNLKLRVSCLLL